MKNCLSTSIMFVALLLADLTIAGDLTYPTTVPDIVAALTQKDGKASLNGVDYVSEQGKVYQIIGGKRWRIRDLGGIVDTDLAPKAGALIQFDFNSAAIRAESFGLLENYVRALTGDTLADAVLQIGGHADIVGTPERNLELSRQRAEAVQQYLTQRGIARERLQIAAFGATRPVESNATEDGRAKNRRVEFIRIE